MRVYESYSLYEPNIVRRNARKIARLLRKVQKKHQFDAVIVTGKSGISMAYAAMIYEDFNLVVVRKAGESSHGDRIEGNSYGGEIKRYVILDDLTETGATVRNIQHQLNEYCESNYAIPELVALILYKPICSTEMETTVTDIHGIEIPIFN